MKNEISSNTVDFELDIGNLELDDFQLELAEEVLDQLDQVGQSGLEVMTSGGKSYIASHIMKEYMCKHRDGKILWLAPKSAITNVKNKIFSKTLLKNRIEYLGYEELARGNTYINCKEEDVKLIVFDECHKAYAKKTYENLTLLLDNLEHSDRLAMSATPVRYGGINTFNILVPKATKHIRFDIKDAAEHDLLPKIVYVLANMKISASDFATLEKYKKLIKNNTEAEELYDEVINTLSNFQFNLEMDLGELLTSYIKPSGDSGERHIAFFSSISSLQNMRPAVEKAFKNTYPGYTINILEYHSGISDEENKKAFQQFVIDDPEPRKIDVMLSVDKATESIHPDNVRSVLMFRGTNSVRVYLQQMGRGIMLKSYHPEDVVIFDFADNVECVGIQGVYRGRKPLEERKKVNEQEYSNSIDDIKEIILNQFGYHKGLTTEIGLSRVNNCIQKINEIFKLERMSKVFKAIDKFKAIHSKLRKRGVGSDTKNIYTILYEVRQEIEIEDNIRLKDIWKNSKEDFDKFYDGIIKDFKAYQRMYLDLDSDINAKIKDYFDSIGHSAYLIYGNGRLSAQMIADIDYIKADINKYGSIELSQNTHAKHKLNQLRLEYAKKTVPSNICVYARRNNVDIEMSKIRLEDIANLCETEFDRKIANEFKAIAKLLALINNDYDKGQEIKFDDWLTVKAKILVTHRRYRDTEMACICMSYIENKYGYIIDGYRLTQNEIENGAKLLSALLKIEDDELPNKIEEDYIFNHTGFVDFSGYESKILKEFGITKLKYSDIENKTEFMQVYKKALDGDEESIRKMLGYNKNSLDTKRKKLLNTTTFRKIKEDTKDTLGAEVLIKKAKLMCDPTEDYKKLRKDLSDALSNGTIQHISIALAPFRDYEIEFAEQVLEYDADTFEQCASNLAVVTPLSILVTRCSQSTSCSKEVIKQVLKINALDKKLKARLSEIYDLIEK